MKKKLGSERTKLGSERTFMYVQNQALKACSNTCPCFDFISKVQIHDIVKYLPFNLKRIRKLDLLKD